MTAIVHKRDGGRAVATAGEGMGEVRERRKAKLQASQPQPRWGCYLMSQGARGKWVGIREQGKLDHREMYCCSPTNLTNHGSIIPPVEFGGTLYILNYWIAN